MWPLAMKKKWIDNFVKYYLSADTGPPPPPPPPLPIGQPPPIGPPPPPPISTTDYVLKKLNKQRVRMRARSGKTRSDKSKNAKSYEYVRWPL